jgi:HK97 gp10 family phage protein
MGYTSNVGKVTLYIDDWQNRALEAIGQFIDSEASLRCPVDIGNLRDSLRYYVNKERKFVRNGCGGNYAIFVEKGTGIYAAKGDGRKTPWFYTDDKGIGHWTRGMKAQPFLTPAAEENQKNIAEIVRRVKFASGTN